MSHNRRVLTYVAIALIVGAALALAAALASNGAAGAAGDSASGGASPSVSGLYSEDEGAETLTPADPAKERPPLDQFQQKDPFIQFPQPGQSGSSGTSTPSPSASATPSSLSAKVSVDGTSYNVSQGDKVPGGSAATFTVTAVASNDVSFEVIDGTLKGGGKTFSVALGTTEERELDSGVVYTIKVNSIGSATGGGGSGGSVAKGHSISVLSINNQDGAGVATFEVDGKTYSDKKQGDVFSTSWGEIQVVSIAVGAQTVTIRHGDQTLTLYAGQVVVK